MKIVLIANLAKCTQSQVNTLAGALTQHHQIIGYSNKENRIDIVRTSEGVDVAIVMGGDGTIISAVHYFGKNQIPIIGINFGKIGYLANFNYEAFLEMAMADTWPSFLNRDCPESLLSERMLLGTTLQLGGEPDYDAMAVNDVVIDIGYPFRTITVRIYVNNKWLTDIRGDGVIVSTPTGSTAYNLSAGGPILQPEADVIAITPKNPHALSFRPLVVDGSSTITLAVENPEGAYVIIDGQKVEPMSEFESGSDTSAFDRFIEIIRLKPKLIIVNNHGDRHQGYWEILRTKLKWGV